MASLRALRLLTPTSTRTLTRQLTTHAAPRLGCLLPAKAHAAVYVRGFSASSLRFGDGATDVALSQKLQEELKYEAEANAEVENPPEFLKAFKQQGFWQIEDIPGHDEVTLTRKFGNENLRLMFSIADLQSEDEIDTPEAEVEGEGNEEGEDDAPYHAYPVRVSLSIVKTSGPGALSVDMVCQEGNFIVDNVSYYKDAKLGNDLTAEADWKRRGLYIGPQFDTLDVSVQEEFEKFLQERGVNEHVALFIPEYAEYKEQTEYVKWLENVKNFVEQ